MEYGSDHAELYDLVFASRGRDPQAEAESLTSLIRSRFPGAKSLLDVACGTGAHLETLARHFRDVEGLEYSPGMLRVAERRLPGLTVHPGDMRTFDLGRTFDAVTCMFYAIAEVGSPEELAVSVSRMAAHLNPGGVLILEPWFFPDKFIDGYVGGHMVTEAGRVIARMTHSVRQGAKTRMQIKFVVADASGFKEFTDVLLTSLFTREEYETALRCAGFSTEFVPDSKLPGRPHSPGLFVGIRD
jgi:N-dimethyltransferase